MTNMNLIEQLSNLNGFKTIMLVSDVDKALDAGIEVIKALQLNGYDGLYISFSTTLPELLKSFYQGGIDSRMVYIIDGISSMYGLGSVVMQNASFVESPLALEGIKNSITDGLQKLTGEKRFLFIDSITVLRLYNGHERTTEFVKTLREIGRKQELVTILEVVRLVDKTRGNNIDDPDNLENSFIEKEQDTIVLRM